MLSTLSSLFVVAAIVSMTSARDNFYDVTVESLGQTASLFCNETYEFEVTASNFTNPTPVSWMMPNLTIVETSFDKGRLNLTNNNWTLVITNVTDTDLGLYHCMLTAVNISYFLCRAGLNAQGPYFEDMWEKYWLNTVIGLAAFFGFLLLALVTWLLWHFRYKSPEEKEAEKRERRGTLEEPYLSAFEVGLPAVAVVGEPSLYPTKMTEEMSDGHGVYFDNSAYSHNVKDDDSLTAF